MLGTASKNGISAGPGADRVFDFCRAPHAFLLDLCRASNTVAHFRMNDESFVVLSDPEAIHAVYHAPIEEYEKGKLVDLVESVFGESVFTVDGQKWRNLRDVITPLFSRARIEALAPIVGHVVAQWMNRWAATGAVDDLLTDTKRLAFDVVAAGLIGLNHHISADQLFAVLHRADRIESVKLKYLSQRASGLCKHFQKLALTEEVDRAVYGIAHTRIAAGPGQDFLGAAMSSPYFQALDEPSRLRFVRDLVSSMLSAGYVTTGESLFWCLYLLARDPEMQERARREPIWAHAVIAEGLRLYPPTWFVGRIALRPVTVQGERLDAGTRVLASPWVLHRMEAFWPTPDEFHPERFVSPADPSPRTYIPFGSGPRACVGRGLAMMELATLVPAVLERFEMRLKDERPMTLAGTFTTQPRETVRMQMTER